MDKKKRNVIIAIVCFLLIAIVGIVALVLINKPSEKEKEEKKSVVTPLLYKVTKDGSDNVMYLFGSIHAGKKDTFPLPDYVLKAYEESDYLACELDIVHMDAQTQSDVVNKFLYQDGTTLKDHMSLETYNRLVEYFGEESTYLLAANMYKPYFAYSLLSNDLMTASGLNANYGIDAHMIKKATSDKKEIIELETFEFQYDLLFSMSDELTEVMINEFFDDYDELVKNEAKLYDIWARGDADELVNISSEDDASSIDYLSKEQKENLIAEINDYNKRLVNDRNITMAQSFMDEFEENKKVFFMVGVMHLVDDNGIAAILESNGYKVEKIN